MSRLRKGELPLLCQQLGFVDPTAWVYVPNVWQLPQMAQGDIECMSYHHSVVMLSNGPGGRTHQSLIELLRKSDRITLLTVWTLPRTLRQRNRARFIHVFLSLRHKPRELGTTYARLRRIWRRDRQYRHSINIFRLYDAWFRFTRTCGVTAHWIIGGDGEMTTAKRLDNAMIRLASQVEGFIGTGLTCFGSQGLTSFRCGMTEPRR
jgi:hypothetical protein